MKRLLFALLLALTTGVLTALAQESATPEVPFANPVALVTVTPDANDARAAACSAATIPEFAPYVVRPGDTLASLSAGQTAVTVAQLAALNCVDDPDALPVGAVIWLPRLPVTEALSATPEATAEATATVTAEATAEATAESQSAAIESFAASAATLNNSDPVTLRWSAAGSSAYVYACPVATCVRPANAQPVPLSGSVTLTGFQAAGSYRYRLDVEGAGGPVTQDVSLEVACAQDWLGGIGASPLCPQDPARTVYAVWQPFQHGVMIWFSDSKQIYVMSADGQVVAYVDQYVDGQPDPGEKAPNGLLTPVRGFGALWEALGGADSPLGWAQAKEVGYDAARQAAGRTSYTTYIAGPGSTVYAVTQLPGATVGYWAQVAW
ncbi:MAG: LysM peptidoglycan-binding domain-containing protein [Chloroflexi bacterium]|nr:LysM peptidoglycan-binding domain-containing protein [Chloroflexota bacterium]